MEESIPLELCGEKPYEYKLCGNSVCIRRGKSCPCLPDDEFRCSLENCIPIEFKCDGLKQCLYGEDEKNCAHSLEEPLSSSHSTVRTESQAVQIEAKGLSLPLIVVISSLCVFLFALLLILVYVVVSRRNNRNTSRESQSASVPLRKSYIRADSDIVVDDEERIPDVYTNMRHMEYDLKSPYYPLLRPLCNNLDQQLIDKQSKTVEEENIEEDRSDGTSTSKGDNCAVTESPTMKNIANEHNTSFKQNLALKSGVEIYDMDNQSPNKIRGLGRYTFKPRIKYLKSVPFTELEVKDREKLYVINSYKHCAGKSILPATLNFDKDPDTFTKKFANDLLCSSTPRQPVRHLARPVDEPCLQASS